MKKIYLTAQCWIDLRTVLNALRIKTDCFKSGVLLRAYYLACVDDDPRSANYAAELYHQMFKTYGFYPKVLCVGGYGKLSGPMNGKGMSEGKKLAYVCERLGVRQCDIVILDGGTNTGINARDVALHIMNECKAKIRELNKGLMISDQEMAARMQRINHPVIFCLTERLSWRFERTVKYLSHQYPDLFKIGSLFFEIQDYYYVPGETLGEMLAYFNGKGLAGGIMLLAEVASIWERYEETKGRFMMPLGEGEELDAEVLAAIKRLIRAYPLKSSKFNIRKLWQYPYAYVDVISHKKLIRESLEEWIEFSQEKFRNEYKLKSKISEGKVCLIPAGMIAA